MQNPEFFDILEQIIAKQHQVLINKGLSSEFNSNITKNVRSYIDGGARETDTTPGNTSHLYFFKI